MSPEERFLAATLALLGDGAAHDQLTRQASSAFFAR
jgi:hypothetical protein